MKKVPSHALLRFRKGPKYALWWEAGMKRLKWQNLQQKMQWHSLKEARQKRLLYSTALPATSFLEKNLGMKSKLFRKPSVHKCRLLVSIHTANRLLWEGK